MNTARNRGTTAALWLVPLMLAVVLAGCSKSGDVPVSAQPRAAGEAQHAGDAGQGEHEEEGHAEEAVVRLSQAQRAEFGIELRKAGSGSVALTRELPGEVTTNPTRTAQVTPRVPGVVDEVSVTVGDHVKQGQVMAVMTSRELARAKSEYLAALSRLDLSRANFDRVAKLWKLQITPKADYLVARQAREEAQVAVRLAKHELHALGLSEAEVANLAKQPEKKLASYELTAPIGGEVVERSITEGEVVSDNPVKPPFIVADLDNVWVQLTVYPKDLAVIQPGQEVEITAQGGLPRTTGTIAYVSPIVGKGTRTGTARVVLANPEGRWKPGLFVTGRVDTAQVPGEIVVPESALQTIEGKTVVFVQTDEGFEPRPVEVGRSNGEHVQIVSGLQPGDTYVAANGFILKAELLKGTFAGHSH